MITTIWSTFTYAQPGSLDDTFGSGGIVVTALGDFGDMGNSILIQGDDKILLGGYTQSNFTSADFALMRFNYDGTLDSNFGMKGRVITTIENRSEGHSLLIQEDEKIVLGGASDWYINLVRYDKDGALDLNFGTDGKVIIDIEGYYSEQCRSVAIQEDGKILVGGYAQHFSNDNSYFVLVRCNDDGSLDSSFGTNGIVIGSLGKANSIGIQEDGKIILGGASDGAFALERYNSDGTLDTSFGEGGKVITTVGSFGEGHSLLIQDNGKIVLGGYSNNGTSHHFAMVRYNSDGSLDAGFGIGGKVITAVGSAGRGHSLAMQEDGKIFLAGYGNDDSNNSNFAIARYNSDGTLDSTFGTDGIAITPIGNSYGGGNSLRIHSNGKIVVGGYIYGSNLDIALVRYNGDLNVETEEICCEDRSIRIYPNPFNAATSIQLNHPLHQAEMNVYNAYGQLVRTVGGISGQEIQLSRDHLADGLYFLQLVEKGKVVATNKLIISKN